ncbi:MAG: deoxyribonuclease V [Wenzhouxiangella sp.]
MGGGPPAVSALIEQQRRLAERVVVDDALPARLRAVAGVDAAFPEGGRTTRAAVVLMSYPGLETIEETVAERPTRLPYIPGLLSFRELPAILAALDRLSSAPDLVLCDGQGIAHPRRFGVACHLGVETGLCTIGVGKSRLCGQAGEPGRQRGAWSALQDRGETIGRVLRTRTGVRPVFVSSGHRVSLETAARLVLDCTPRYRLPEPIRAADRLAGTRR